jgi:hypothetical protein
MSHVTYLRKALRSLQNAAGVYGMAVPSADVYFPGNIVGHLTGGETLRTVVTKEQQGKGKGKRRSSNQEVTGAFVPRTGTGYGVKLTYDVPQGRHNGQLTVRVCWHSIVYVAQVDYAIKHLIF